LPGIAEGKLDMLHFFNECGTPSCLAGHACASGRFPLLVQHKACVFGLRKTFGVYESEWNHIFDPQLPNNPSWLAANITDLLEGDK